MKPVSFDTHASTYAEGPPRQVPGLSGLHRMAMLLLAERVPDDGQVLVLGAGGGLELEAFAAAQARWTFDGVDPSPEMLAVARERVEAYAERVRLHRGTIEAAPEGPFDGAACLLTMHFVPREKRLETLRQVRMRLKDGAPFVLAHISFPQTEPERSAWIARHVAYGAPDGMTVEQAESARQAIGTRLTILSPEEEEEMLRAAGFSDVSLFYAAFSFRGWVAYG